MSLEGIAIIIFHPSKYSSGELCSEYVVRTYLMDQSLRNLDSSVSTLFQCSYGQIKKEEA